MSVVSAASACPICQSAITSELRCAHCHWVLRGDLRLGPVTAEDRRRFDSELATAARQYDLIGARRAIASGDEAQSSRIARLVRGGMATPEELLAIVADPAAAARPTAADVVVAELNQLGCQQITVVDIGGSEVRVLRIGIDEFGGPVALEPIREVAWQALLPGLPSDPAAALFRLAGGIGDDPRRLPDVDPDVVGAAIHTPTDRSDHTVVLNNASGWTIPDAVAAHFGRAHVVTGPRIDADFPLRIAQSLPLRLDHGLVAVSVDTKGATTPFVHTLFRTGDIACDTGAMRVAFTVPEDCDQLLVALVAGDPDADSSQFVPIGLWRCTRAAVESGALAFTLERPGVIRLAGSVEPSAVPSGPEFSALLEDIPDKYQTGGHAMDLALLVELGGPPAEVTVRRRLLAEILMELAKRHPCPEGIRVAVIGYGEHSGHGKQEVLRSYGFGTLDSRRAALDELSSVRVIEQWAAPLEDALNGACRLAWRDPAVRRRLVIIGSRPPYPAVDGLVGRCVNNVDWRRSLQRLRTAQVEQLVIWDPPRWISTRSTASKEAVVSWQQLAAPGHAMRLANTTADSAVVRGRLLDAAKPTAPLRFPIIVN